MSVSNIMSADIVLKGEWQGLEGPSKVVLNLVRDSCLKNLALRSDRQPSTIIVENGKSVDPSIWLHESPKNAAWIRLNSTPSAWCQLAYQFCHELGHVLANSWTANAKPQPPSQWIEEALAEVLALFGLSQLAIAWKKAAPFPNNEGYSKEIEIYLKTILSRYKAIATKLDANRSAEWYLKEEEKLESDNGLYPREQAFASVLYSYLINRSSLIEDYAALNLWSERTALSNISYLAHWKRSCENIGTSGDLPRLLGKLLHI